MNISARVTSRHQQHVIEVQTGDAVQPVQIAPKSSGFGSSVNGGELLLLALATCFCNDIYREAAKRNITVSGVDVVFAGEFGAEGEPGTNFTYQAHVISDAPAAEIEELIRHTDRIAEVHATLRKGVGVTLVN